MDRTIKRWIAWIAALVMSVNAAGFAVFASEVTDEAVAAVIAQLEAIDTLQQMQDKRSEYSTSGHYDTGTTNTDIIAAHEAARAEYETYVSMMFSARAAARQAYDALSAEQQAQIDLALVEKLDDVLPTVFHSGTFSLTPRSDAYSFEAVDGGFGYAYEVSHHMVTGNIPQTFVLVDTADGKTSWTPNGKYAYGQSNYEVLYCCDIETALVYGTHYKRMNLEDSGYYGESAARHIRGILLNSYPYITMDEMKDRLKAGGLSADFVDSLTRSDMISAVQMAVWTYANANDGAQNGLGYFASIDVTKNTGVYFTPLHDHNNECWDWLPKKAQRSYDARAAYRVNNLAYYLCGLEADAPDNARIVISDVQVTRAELVKDSEGTYDVGMYIYLNHAGTAEDDLKLTITSYHTNEDGTVTTTAQTAQYVGERGVIEMTVKAASGDTIRVSVEGTQSLGRGVYFYEPEGGREASQSLVGVGEGDTYVKAEEYFTFTDSVGEVGLRFYKTETDTGLPISDIVFHVYKVSADGEGAPSESPTEEEIALYATQENLVGSITTDVTGYGEIALEKGTYLIVEEHNVEKTKEPVKPFYVTLPMWTAQVLEDGSEAVIMTGVVSVYPKNTPVPPSEDPPEDLPTPDSVTGSFEIYKHDRDDTAAALEGAEFAVYRLATETDANTQTLVCDGVQYVVTPVMVDGEHLVLKTDAKGSAVSPELECGVYFLKETQAPAGYNLREDAIPVTVRSSVMTSRTLVEISNEPGNLLPETGGRGTTMLLVLGSVLTVGAVVLLVTQKRMRTYS